MTEQATAPSPRGPHRATRAAHRLQRERSDFSDRRDFENARRGLIQAAPDQGIITNDWGRPVWDLSAYQFLDDTEAIETVNPSLLRMARLNMANGLFMVTDRVYQLRGLDLANMTVIEGDTGLTPAKQRTKRCWRSKGIWTR